MRTKLFIFSLLTVFVVIISGSALFSKTIYVDEESPTPLPINQDGSSWELAFAYFQDALYFAESGDEIWVAEGTYYPNEFYHNTTIPLDRTASFTMINKVEIYGGFDPTNNIILWDDRNPRLYKTILSGEIGTPAISDNSYHVVYNEGVDETAILDGFFITGGYADGIEPPPPVGEIIYVDTEANSNTPDFYGDGETWETAFNFLQDALAEAQPWDEIWVAEGSYYPDEDEINFNGTDLRDAHFSLINDVKVYGGFDPSINVIEFEDRNWEDNETILSGEIGLATNTDNSIHIFVNDHVNENAVLDGFSIEKGYCSSYESGAAMENIACHTTVRNCIFRDNYSNWCGGAINSQYSYEVYEDCQFENNHTIYQGGAVYLAGSGGDNFPKFDRCTFDLNTSQNTGGAFFGQSASTYFLKCDFTNNDSPDGGAIHIRAGNEVFENCSFINNSAHSGSAISSNYNNSKQIKNCIFTGNNIGGYTSSGGNVLLNFQSNGDFIVSNCTFTENNTEYTIYNYQCWSTFVNTILWNPYASFEFNTQLTPGMPITYCNVKGGYGGDGNINELPLFTSAPLDLSLSLGSPCIDAANGNEAPENDILGLGRVDNLNDLHQPNTGTPLGYDYVDIGAYECQLTSKGPSNAIAHKNHHFSKERILINSTATFADNKGGGIFNSNSSPRIINCVIRNNFALYGGGAYNIDGLSSPVFHDCYFKLNRAEINGGAMYDNSLSIITNNIFSENFAEQNGGAIYNAGVSQYTGKSLFITNCTFSGNFSKNGEAVACENVETGDQFYIEITNSILWDKGNEIWPNDNSVDISYSDIFKGYTGTGNIDKIPNFVDPGDDFHLLEGSDCINTGSNSAPYLPDFDFDGNPRILDEFVDMGAYEFYQPITIIYVDMDANQTIPDYYGNGQSWETAFNFLQDALAIAEAGNEIWVAEGVYHPDENKLIPNGNGFRNLSFVMQNEVKIYGGFNATETSIDQRDWVIHETILSGDLRYDNSYHVFYHTTVLELNATAVLDGFIIEDGYANDEIMQERRVGAGMYNITASPSIVNCTFRNNSALAGGALFNTTNSSPVLINCIFHSNTAIYGAAVGNNLSSSPFLEFCTVANNTASAGGGMRSESASFPIVKNSIFWDNIGGQINSDGSSNTTVNYSDIESGWSSGDGNFSENPYFVDATNNNYFLLSKEGYWTATFGWQVSFTDHSPCIDAGDLLSDWHNEPENNGHIANIGAYGNTSKASKSDSHIIYVDVNTTCVNPPNYYGDGSSWDQAYKYLPDALEEAVENENYEIWVSAGTYNPDWDTDLKIITGDRSSSFGLKNGLKIYGGFNYQNGIDRFEERNWEIYQTILSGDIGIVDDVSDNSYHVILNTAGSNLDNTALIDGFVISKGNANGTLNTLEKSGGGLCLEYSDPTIVNCRFENNYAENLGGGVYCGASSPIIVNCSFNYNTAVDGGGGMANSWSEPNISYCSFQNNAVNPISGYGAGIYLLSCSVANISNSLFEGNTAYRGGGASLYNDIFIGEGIKMFEQCTFINNSAVDNGGGIYCLWSSKTIVSDCSFEANSSASVGGALGIFQSEASVSFSEFINNSASSGGAIYIFNWETVVDEEIEIKNSIFSANVAEFNGGAIAYHGYSFGSGGTYILYPKAYNCSFSNNEAPMGNTISNRYACPDITNCIIWGDSDDQIYEGSLSNSNITYSNVRGNTNTAFGNINMPPYFYNPLTHDLHLESTYEGGGRWDPDIPGYVTFPDPNCSPCIDAGDNTPCTEPDGSAIINMGAYGNTYQASKTCASGKWPMSYNDWDNANLRFDCTLSPNPFKHSLSIAINLPDDGLLKVSVFNVTGKKVKTIAETNYNAGMNKMEWDGKDDYGNILPNGIYIITIETTDDIQSYKVILHK